MNHDIQLYQWRIQELDLGGLISSSSSSLLSFNSSSSLSFFSSLSLTKKCWGFYGGSMGFMEVGALHPLPRIRL